MGMTFFTDSIPAAELTGTHVLVSAQGNLADVFDNLGMTAEGLVEIQTEFGSLFLAPDQMVDVLPSL